MSDKLSQGKSKGGWANRNLLKELREEVYKSWQENVRLQETNVRLQKELEEWKNRYSARPPGNMPYGELEKASEYEEQLLSFIFDGHEKRYQSISALPIQSMVNYQIYDDGRVTKDVKFLFKQLKWSQDIIVPYEYGVERNWRIEANNTPIPVDTEHTFLSEIPDDTKNIKAEIAKVPILEGIPPGKYWWLFYEYTCALRVCKFQDSCGFCVLFYPAIYGSSVIINLPMNMQVEKSRLLKSVSALPEGVKLQQELPAYFIRQELPILTNKSIKFEWPKDLDIRENWIKQDRSEQLIEIWKSKQIHQWPLINILLKVKMGFNSTKFAIVDHNCKRWECNSKQCPTKEIKEIR